MRTNSLINNIYAHNPDATPEVGMGATVCWSSDRHAATIVEVSADGETLVVQRDIATRTDSNGMSDCQSYSYEPNPEAAVDTFTRRKNGKYVRKDESTKHGVVLMVGIRDNHFDYSF